VLDKLVGEGKVCYVGVSKYKTLKYTPDFPSKFGSQKDDCTFCDTFFTDYNHEHRHSGGNHEHRHSGIGMHTLASVHFGTAEQIRQAPSTRPTPNTPTASHAALDHPSCPTSPGSTSPLTSHNQPHKHNLSHLTWQLVTRHARE
jgi:putative transposase